MARFHFRLLAGQHVQADRTQKPAVVTNPATGQTTEKFPSKTFKVGETVESDTNLAARFGQDKFELLSGGGPAYPDPHGGLRVPGDPTPEIAAGSPAVAPGGQVSTGFQATTGDGSKSGPMSQAQMEHFAMKGAGESAHAAPSAHATPAKAEHGPHAKTAVNLDAMTAKELHEYAEAEEIPLHGARNKDEIIKAIHAAQRKK